MPVRVRQRAASPSSTTKLNRKIIEHLKHRITACLVAFDQPVIVSLFNGSESTPEARFGSKGVLTGARAVPREIKRPHLAYYDHANGLDLNRLCTILTSAGYIEPPDWSSWIKTSASALDVRICGAFSVQPAPSKTTQFISLGMRPINRESGINPLFEEVNHLFAASRFGYKDENLRAMEATKTSGGTLGENDFDTRQVGGGKEVDRWPRFYIRVSLPEQDDMSSLEKEATMNRILKVLGAMVNGFLESQSLRPQKNPRKQRHQRSSPISPNVRHVSAFQDVFASWNRIKSSHGTRVTTKACTEDTVRESASNENGQSVHDGKFPHPKGETRRLVNDAGEEIVEWINPKTGIRTYINSRTGLVVNKPQLTFDDASLAALRPLSAPGRLTRRISRGFSSPGKGSWADELLSNWSNPVFAPPGEEAVAQVKMHDPPPHKSNRPTIVSRNVEHSCSHQTTLISTNLSKDGLRQARLIAQVDSKFILVSLARESSYLLVLIDQHAADERIRFENLQKDFYSSSPERLAKPMTFEIQSRKELAVFADATAQFASWGVDYSLVDAAANAHDSDSSSRSTSSSSPRLIVKSLPGSIAERCRLEPKLLIDLLRREAWNLHEEQSSLLATTISKPPSKTTRIPRGILDLLSSRACRSAIMFNDVLSREEMQTLIDRLSACDLPFQCAHGRPSAIPLIDVESGRDGDALTAFAAETYKGKVGRCENGRREDDQGGGAGDDSSRSGYSASGVGSGGGRGRGDEDPGYAKAWAHWQTSALST